MILAYGPYPHPDGEALVKSIGRDFEYNELGVKIAMTEKWVITGYKQADTQQLLTAALLQMEAAYRLDNQSIALLTTGGAPTAHFMNANTFDWIRATKPKYPIGTPGEYVTWRQFEIEVTGRLLLSTVGLSNCNEPLADLMSYSETMTYKGTGGPLQQLAQVISGPWPQIALTTNTPVILVQSGSAIGLTGYPDPNPPVSPANILNPLSDISISQGSPKVLTPVQREFPTTWSYTMTFSQNAPAVQPFAPSG